MTRRLATPLQLDHQARFTAWSFVVVHVLATIGLFLVWGNEEEDLPFPWVWMTMHVLAAATVAFFLRYPTRGTRAAAGSFSTVAFSGRAVAYLLVIIVDRSNPLLDHLGARFYLGVIMWLSMAVMGQLLWWWLSEFRTTKGE